MATRSVVFQLYRADGVTASRGTVIATPTRRHASGTLTILPAALSIHVNGSTTQALEVPNTNWCWKLQERVTGGATRYVTFTAGSTIQYNDLTDVDPLTLDPAASPEAAWWLALGTVGFVDTVITYNVDGTVATVTEAGVVTTYTYNVDGTVNTDNRGGVTRTYTYDGSGNLTGITI